MAQEAKWVEIDPSTLDTATMKQYEDYKAMYRRAKEARQAFEEMMQTASGLSGTGKRLVFGYNFGKLSVAVVDDDRKPVKARTGSQSLAQFLSAQANSGRSY